MKPLKKTAVWLQTQEEYDDYMRMAEKEGWLWFDGNKPATYNAWCFYKSETCVYVAERIEYTSKQWYEDKGFKIITLQQLKAMGKKTFKTLEVWDLIRYRDEIRKILAVLHRGDEENESVYVVSYSNKEGTNYLRRASSTMTSYELESTGYTIVEEPEELTMEQVCKELGRTVKIKK